MFGFSDEEKIRRECAESDEYRNFLMDKLGVDSPNHYSIDFAVVEEKYLDDFVELVLEARKQERRGRIIDQLGDIYGID
jgi:hypothetical protein